MTFIGATTDSRMAKEIERKFLVHPDRLPPMTDGSRINQGYLDARQMSVRVRLSTSGSYLTIKSREPGSTRSEFEFEIPREDAEEMLARFALPGSIQKTRFTIREGNHTWEIDHFEGQNEGLTLAEVELSHADEIVELPDWVAEEVTGDPRYFNAYLAHTPYQEWHDEKTGGNPKSDP